MLLGRSSHVHLLQVVVFGGGSFGTAMATALARQKRDLDVVMLLRDPYVCRDINMKHVNSRYLEARLPGSWLLMHLHITKSPQRPADAFKVAGTQMEYTAACCTYAMPNKVQADRAWLMADVGLCPGL